MINSLFLKVINMSITGTLVFLLIILLRAMLKKRPKAFSYALWLIMIFRLLCPVSLTLPFSAFSTLPVHTDGKEIVYVSTADLKAPDTDTMRPLKHEGKADTPDDAAETSGSHRDLMLTAVSGIWFIGSIWFACRMLTQYISIKKYLESSRPYGKETDILVKYDLRTAFTLGIVSPKIYVPGTLDNDTIDIIVTHEKKHIAHHDNLFKFLMCICECIHWFNPLVWIGARLFEKDMEMCCDESIIHDMDRTGIAGYSQALLAVSSRLSGRPLTYVAFGEYQVKERIQNIMTYRKPNKYVTVLLSLLTLFILVGCMTNPTSSDQSDAPVSHSVVSNNHQQVMFPVYHEGLAFTEAIPECPVFTVDFLLPEGWTVDHDNQFPNPISSTMQFALGMGLWNRLGIYDQDGNLAGVIGFNIYEEYEGAERDPQAIYNQIALANHHRFDCKDAYTVISSRPDGETAITEVYDDLLNGDDSETINIGILSYNSDWKVYVGIELFREQKPVENIGHETVSINEETAKMIAESIVFGRVGSSPRKSVDNQAAYSSIAEKLVPGYTVISRSFVPGEHDGLDIAAPKGSPVYSIASGKVLKSGYDTTNGNYLVIEHEAYNTSYCHCDSILVKDGDMIDIGQQIATVGSTGLTTGDVLHFGVYDKSDGSITDPVALIAVMADAEN